MTTIPTMTSYPQKRTSEILQGLLHDQPLQLSQGPGPRHIAALSLNFLPGQHYEPLGATFAIPELRSTLGSSSSRPIGNGAENAIAGNCGYCFRQIGGDSRFVHVS